jgi:hypothetical protein
MCIQSINDWKNCGLLENGITLLLVSVVGYCNFWLCPEGKTLHQWCSRVVGCYFGLNLEPMCRGVTGTSK